MDSSAKTPISRAARAPKTCPLLPRMAEARSRVSNGSEVLPGIDGRTAIARRFRDIIAQLAVDQGGADRLSEARMQLVRRFAAASVLAEQLEARLACGEQIDIAEHAQLSSTLVRITHRIGIDRIPKNIAPSLAEYLQARATCGDDQAPNNESEAAE